jgi:hypothetical protein
MINGRNATLASPVSVVRANYTHQLTRKFRFKRRPEASGAWTRVRRDVTVRAR